jgi:hypothetical protein
MREVAGADRDRRAVATVFELEPALEHEEIGVVVTVMVPPAPVARFRPHEPDPAIIAREGLLPVDARRLLCLRLDSLSRRGNLWSQVHRVFPATECGK